jgi:predicted nucleic acid-binding protein
MDFYLAAFARGHSLKLVTFDKGFQAFRRIGLDVLVLS